MKKQSYWGLGGFLAGLLAGWLVAQFSGESGPVPDETLVTSNELAEAGADSLARLSARLASREQRIRQLEADLEALRGTVAEAAIPEGADPRAEMEARIRERIAERLEGRIGSMVSKYGLSPSQADALRGIFARQVETFRARRSGEAVEPFNLDEALSAVLTPEQFADYLEDSQQEIYNRAELVATSQTVLLSQAVDLSPEMQSLVYETVHLTAQEMMMARQSGEDYHMRTVLDERLESILTPEQMEVVREQPQIGRGFGPGGAGGGGGGFGP